MRFNIKIEIEFLFILSLFVIYSIEADAQEWRFYVDGVGSYWEPDEDPCQVIDEREGIAYIPSSLADTSYYWSVFRLSNLQLHLEEGMAVEMRIRSTEDRGGIDAYDIVLDFFADDNVRQAGCVFIAKERSKRFTRANWGGSLLRDTTALLIEPDWGVVRLEFVDHHHMKIFYDGVERLELFSEEAVCFFDKMYISAKGSGELDWLRFYDSQGILYEENFDDCQDLSVPKTIKGFCGQAFLELGPDTSLCENQGFRLLPDLHLPCGLYDFQWSHPNMLSDSTSLQPVFFPQQDTDLTLTIQMQSPDNLIEGGSFPYNAPILFATDYVRALPSSPLHGHYDIVDSASMGFPPACIDRPGEDSQMMVVDGDSIRNHLLWCQQMDVSQNTDYLFTAWAQGLDTLKPAQLSFLFNDKEIGPRLDLSKDLCQWQSHQLTWNSQVESTLQICIINRQLSTLGNGFAIDDLSLQELCTLSDTIRILATECVEICNNGKDDDYNDLADCFDPACFCETDCESFYFDNCPVSCPADFSTAGMQPQLEWQSSVATANGAPLIAGDLDGDGIAEILTYNEEGDKLIILDGRNGQTKQVIAPPAKLTKGTFPAIGDTDRDGRGEMFFAGADCYLYALRTDGSMVFSRGDKVGYDGSYSWASISLADFDQDGQPEVLIGNQIFDSKTGALLAEGGDALSDGQHPFSPDVNFTAVVAADALPDYLCPNCQGLEIVAGNQVLSVSLKTGVIDLVVQAPSDFSDGYTSIADFDMDGDLDGIVQGSKNGQRHVYIWDLQTDQLIGSYGVPDNRNDIPASRVAIADLDGDRRPDLCFDAYKNLYALDNNLNLIWLKESNNSFSPPSVFDFDADGKAEVIVRDRERLLVRDGELGNIIWRQSMKSDPLAEYPLILDVDGDGRTEILVSGEDGANSREGRIYAFGSSKQAWAKSRTLWNQHAFFNTNANDDLSIPIHQQNPYTDTARHFLIGFLQAYADVRRPVADVAITGLGNVACLGDSLSVEIEICNQGDCMVPADCTLSFYKNNPNTVRGDRLFSVQLGTEIPPGACKQFPQTLPLIQGDSIFVVANDGGQQRVPFLQSDFPLTPLYECDYSNNKFGMLIEAMQFAIDVQPSCPQYASGRIAISPISGGGPYTYDWQLPQPDTSIIENLAKGTYQLSIRNQYHCQKDLSIQVEEFPKSSTRFLTNDASCFDSNDGDLTLFPFGIPPFQFDWQPAAADGSTSLKNLKRGDYVVRVEDGNNCIFYDTARIDAPPPLQVFSHVQAPSCHGEASGKIIIDSIIGGIPPYRFSFEGLQFESIDAFPLILSNRFAGIYELNILDQHNCTHQWTLEIPAANDNSVEFDGQPYWIDLGESKSLNPIVNFNPQYIQWSPSTYLDCDTCLFPTSAPKGEITYQLRLQDSLGCTLETSITLNVNLKDKVFIPNVITPNGDQINDVHQIHLGPDVAELLYYRVFDRWGASLYEAQHLAGEQSWNGWNGTHKGRPMPIGVYMYSVSIRFIDGRTRVWGGTLTLVR